MRRSPGHRVNIGTYRICPVSQNSLRVYEAMPRLFWQACSSARLWGCRSLHRTVAIPQHPQSAPLPRPHVVYHRPRLHTQCSIE